MDQEHLTVNFILERRGSNIHYWTSGPKGTPLVVFTHGAALDHRMFEQQVSSLNAAGYRVLSWDMRGHGQSKPMGKGFTLKIAVEDLLAIIDELGCETATFIGHSFGGFVSQEMTFRHAERVKAVGVIGCTDLAKKPSRGMAVMSKVFPYLLPLFSLENFRKRTVENVSVKEAVTTYAYGATGRLSKEEFIPVIMAGVACLSLDMGYGADYRIPRPFLLTHGEHDKANNGIFTKSSPAWAKKEPLCVYQVIPQAGHTANQDNPEAFNAVLLDFLREHVPV